MSLIREVTINDRTIRFEFNKFAKQANGSVMVSSGNTQVLVTVCAAEEAAPDVDFFPLGVDYIEKSYAVGKVPAGFIKREGKPGDLATLTARVIDRPLRPCFPKAYRNETVITATVMSYEHGYSPAPLALVGASTALMISEIPFDGPVAALRLGMKEGQYLIDPPEGQEGDLDLNIACRPDAVLMVEAAANFLTEEQMLAAIEFAHETMKPLFDMQLEIQKEIGKPKWTVQETEISQEIRSQVRELGEPLLKKAFAVSDKMLRGKALKDAGKSLMKELNPEGHPERAADLKSAWSQCKSDYMRTMILKDRSRIDQRRLDEIRPIACETGLIKKAHGSALFTRGETQALATVTLAAEEDQQRLETFWDQDLRQRFMLHYNFPPFSVGEARMQRSPGRREIGHGNLARRALLPVIPDASDFGFTIRLVSETLESNGSSSMAAVCSGSMAMMQAGVPLREPVAGIAMGLIKEGDEYAILSDILGDEDHLGDMDFKVCGTATAITALQMDIKIGGLTQDIMKEALNQAREGRLHILGKLKEAIPEPASEVAPHAPRIFRLKIKQDKIRDLIGPGGKNIKRITSESSVKMDIDDQGMIAIVAPDAASAQAAKSMIRAFTSTPQVGEVYLGKAVRLTDFGVFVEIKPGVDGLCHITQLSDQKIRSADEVVKQGDELLVKIVDIDRQGRIKLSRKEAFGEAPISDS
ncbi:MAG: polyribonucleotide nucleotidyltransferase [Deltaproteobacteria bacterium]|nr:polyribonucleotide nucleotidyltransferase [Deltaproteobacteria bacterium]